MVLACAGAGTSAGANAARRMAKAIKKAGFIKARLLMHDPENRKPAFRKDHARTKSYSEMLIRQ
jgi:predicted alpha/beta-hydrolase family hydrolase